MRLLQEYTGLNFNELIELDCYTYKVLLKDAFVYTMRQTEKGTEYLRTCWELSQTEPDRQELRKNLVKAG